MINEIKKRMFRLAVDDVKLCTSFPLIRGYSAYCNQIIWSSSSEGANYRAACRGKWDKDFINKLKIVGEEADETMYWQEILKEFSHTKHNEIVRLHKETNELLSIAIASIKTVKNRINA